MGISLCIPRLQIFFRKIFYETGIDEFGILTHYKELLCLSLVGLVPGHQTNNGGA